MRNQLGCMRAPQIASTMLEHALAVGEHVEHRRERAQILGEGAVPDEMARDAEELAQHDADHLHPVRHLDARQLSRRRAGTARLFITPPR